MKRFLFNILWFILPLVLLMYPADYFISKYLSESKDYAYGETKVWKDIYDGNIDSQIVIYGSSRAWVHISPKIIRDSLQFSSYNLGIDGHHFGLQYFRHQQFLKFNTKPSLIIMSLDIFTLQKGDELYNYQQFLPYMLWNKDIEQYTSSYIGFSTYDYTIPLLRYLHEREALVAASKTLLHLKTIPSRVNGYSGIEQAWNSDLNKAKEKSNYYEAKFDSTTVSLFDRFLNECNQKGIRVILVYSPEYMEGQAFVKNRKAIISNYRYFAEKYNLPFLDYSNDTICMQKQLFYNAEHLNKEGSELFTRKLVQDIRKTVGSMQ